jgi:hypothetical protein
VIDKSVRVSVERNERQREGDRETGRQGEELHTYRQTDNNRARFYDQQLWLHMARSLNPADFCALQIQPRGGCDSARGAQAICPDWDGVVSLQKYEPRRLRR